MTKLFLDVGKGLPVLDEQRRECVATFMEPDSSQSCLLEAFLEVPLLQIFHILEAALFILEYPGRGRQIIFALGQEGFFPVAAQFGKCCHQSIRDIDLPDLARLGEIDLAANDAPAHHQEFTILIEIAPLERRRFSLPEFKRFGSFPDDFLIAGDFEEGIRQVGDCLPPLFMRAIAAHLRGIPKTI